MRITHNIRMSSDYTYGVIDRFSELKDKFHKASELAAEKDKRKSKIHIQSRFRVNRWGR